MTTPILYIGNKTYSSWSLRPWLALAVAGIPFEERLMPFDSSAFAEAQRNVLPAGRVPVLVIGDLTVWDSLAILEYVAERFAEARLWPEDVAARAVARSVSAEMHSGFGAIRSSMPMNVRKTLPGLGRTPATLLEIERVQALWRDCRERFGAEGPFLFGRFSVADAVYAPVVTRFETYGVALDAVCRRYADAVLGLPAMAAWYDAARAEPWVVVEDEIC